MPQAHGLAGIREGPEVALVAKDCRLIGLGGPLALETEAARLRRQTLHPELARGGERAREEGCRLRSASGRVGTEEQASVSELGPGAERACPHTVVQRGRVCEVAARLGDAPERRRQQTEVMGDGSPAREPGARDGNSIGVG